MGAVGKGNRKHPGDACRRGPFRLLWRKHVKAQEIHTLNAEIVPLYGSLLSQCSLAGVAGMRFIVASA